LLIGMTADMQTARTAARLHEAVQDLARLACAARPGVNDGITEWIALASDLADRYHVQLDGLDTPRGLRYVAIARSLGIRPYCIVTTDPDELRLALCGSDEAGATAEPLRGPGK
jgi:hypothetical protein